MKREPKTIKELFSGTKVFKVPEYQRPYAWEKEHLNAFVEDISEKTERNHFFGTILYQEKRSGNFTQIDIVDGQQRITTLIIFIKLLLEKLEKSDNNLHKSLEETYIQNDGKYKLNVLPIDDDYFKSSILKNDLSAADHAETPSQNRLLEAKKWFKTWLDNWYNEDSSTSLQQLISKIENMQISTYLIKDNTEAALVFETTNDRGKLLTNLDKAKSFLMYKGSLTSPENSESFLETLQNRFGKIYQYIDEIGNRMDEDTVLTGNQIDENTILQYHCIAFERWTSARDYRQPVKMIRQIVNKLIEEENNQKTKDFIDKCSLRLQKTFADINKLLLRRNSYIRDIFILKRPAIAYHLLIKAYRLDTSPKKQNFERIARLLEIICFRFGIENYKVDKGRGRLYRLSRDFTGNFDQLVKDLKKFVDDLCDFDHFERRLSLPTFYKDIKHNDLLYLFWKYENYLRKDKQPISAEMSYDQFVNEDPRTKFSLDHISPQNPKDNTVVEEEPESNESTTLQEFKDNYLHSIGNLVLDSISANSSKSNHNFDVKYRQFYSESIFKQQKELKNFGSKEENKLIWNELAIDNRKEKIVEFALGYWNHEKV